MVTMKQKFIFLPDGTVDVETWLIKIKTHYHLENTDLVSKTCYFAKSVSKGLTTFYGQPCIEQGLEMAEIILDLKLDQEAVAAAIITSTIQHTKLDVETITKQLGDDVGNLISGVQKMNAIRGLHKENRDHTQIDRLRKMLLAMVSDIRVVLIKLAERTCIMRGIKNINPIERKRIAQETLDIYAPLANRLGIGQLKWELEDIAFHYTHPDDYKTIAKFLAERRTDREKRIHDVIARLQEQLHKVNIEASLSGRAKHIYSIYLKMQRKELGHQHIYDYSAVRVLVPTLQDCYSALSIVHGLWEHIPEEFDDYIANPKSNGYRSIHTAVIGPDGKNLEIQIRTRDMHEEAEHGVAAHWMYKESKPQQSGYESKITFLRQLLAWHKDIAKEDTTDEKLDTIFEDCLYVFTPAGDILELPNGATPLDFAYHVHSGLGHRCRGAKINGHIVPLSYTLQTGDQVEILTIQNGTPSRDWLNKESGYLKTSRARAKVMQWFKHQEVSQHIDEGKRLLERELTRSSIHHFDLHKAVNALNFKDEETLLAALGRGSIRPAQVVHAVQAPAPESVAPSLAPFHVKTKDEKTSGFEIAGVNDLLTRIAKCCKPIPGDNIIGYITQGRGVSIHKKDCSNISHLAPHHTDRLIQVTWDSKHAGTYYVDVQIQAQGQGEVLREISALLTNAKVDLITLNSKINKNNNMTLITLTMQIHNLEQFKQLLNHINQLPNVVEAKRINE